MAIYKQNDLYRRLTREWRASEIQRLEASNGEKLDLIARALANYEASHIVREARKGGLHLMIPHDNLDSLRVVIDALKPWRKGPFHLHSKAGSLCIDSEWQSWMKLELVLDVLKKLDYKLEGKSLLDVGCNNGYYMMELALRGVREAVGLDPMPPFFLQFYLMLGLAGLDGISYRLLGIQNIIDLGSRFDCVLCLGVLYHREEPLEALRILKTSLNKKGLLLLETLVIEEDAPLALLPYPSYAGMKKAFYIFSPSGLENLARRAGFRICELLSLSHTTPNEQRSTDFINAKSLGDLLKGNKTIEGYPMPCRGLFALKA